MAKAKDLVIVESPSKAKTIGKYLGSDYRVTASMGHLRDLPKNKLGVNVQDGFQPEYIPVKEKKDLIEELREDSRKAPVVYLATDPDREGEAISWHLKELLGLSDEKAKRVTFNEITKKVVTESIQNPRSIDQDLVDAQQARRVLDRIVGYQISPLLWKKVKRGLSAGRVQSVAARMVVDREDEIRAFQSEEYWLLDVLLKREPHFRNSAAVWKLCETDRAEGFITTLSFVNLVDIMRKELSPAQIRDVLNRMQLIFRFADFTASSLLQAAELQWDDFEDAVQSVIADQINADCIITHNVRDFRNSKITAFTPAEFLARI